MVTKLKLRLLKWPLLFLVLTFVFINIFASSPLPHTNLAQAAVLPTIYVDPPSVIDSGLTPGNSFTVDIMISDADFNEGTDVYAWQVYMKWEPSVLDIDATVIWGDFLVAPRVGPWGLLTADAASGQKIVNVADGSKFTAGYAVLIEDDSNSEENQVASVLGTQLTMKDNLVNTYTVAANGGAYPQPNLTPTALIDQDWGDIMAGTTSSGPAPGAQGNGWLSTFTFHVQAEAETTLDIDWSFTYIINGIGETKGDAEGELIKESGFFSNIGGTQYTLTIGVVGSGTTDPAPGTHLYDEGLGVPVDAIPDGGWELSHWLLDGVNVGSADPYTVTMDDDHTLTAVFIETIVQYELTIGVVGSGTTVPAPGVHLYDEGTLVPVDAIPDSGYMLDYWLLDGVNVGSADPYTVTMNADHTLTAYFVVIPPIQYTLTLSVVGSGTTVPSPDTYTFDAGTEVEVASIPDSGWELSHWLLDGVDVGSADPYTVIMNDNRTLTAVFVEMPTEYTLTIEVVGSGTTNPSLGTHQYDAGSEVPVATIPDSGWELNHWLLDGVNVGSADPYTVTMDDNHTLTAVFTEIPPTQYELTIGVVGSGTTDPAPGTHLYDEGLGVPVDAIPDSGWELSHWLLDGVDVGSGDPYTVTMNADHALTAYFVEIPPTQYTLTISVTGSGTTDPSPGSYLHDEGLGVPVDAIPDSGYMLDYWLLDGVDVGSADPYTVTMDDDHSLTAVFTEVSAVLMYVDPSVVSAGPGDSFTLNINIQNVEDLFAYEVKLGFNKTVLGPFDVEEGPFIKDQTTSPVGTYFTYIIDDDYAYVACVTLGKYPGVSGSGNLFTVTFNVLDTGESDLPLYDSILLDSSGDPISHDTTGGYFSTPPPTQYTLTIDVVGSGTTVPAPGVHLYDEGSEVPVDAIPDSGWELSHWLLDGVDVGSADPYTVTMDANHTLTAVFVELPPTQYELTIDVVGAGTTEPSPGTYLYDEGSEVPVDAIPDSGWMLDHWLLDGVDVGSVDPYTVTMNTDHTLTAVFGELPPTQYTLTISVVGSGTTVPTPGTYQHDEGSGVPVDAIPDSGWMLNHWLLDGVDVGSADPYTVTMNDDHTLTAVFTEIPPTQYTLTISVVGSGTTVPAPGVHLYDEGLGVPVDAIPDGGWLLDHWLLDGVDVGSADPYTVTMNDDHSLTAVFTEISGVDVTPPTITINEPVAGDYLHSESITLDFNAVDTESGVASISATLDGITVENGDLIELFTFSLGLHTLTVTAVDNAGNSATETVEFNVIATIDSLIGLVEKFYDLGYIDEEDVASGLIDKLYAAQKKIEQGKPEVAKKMLKAFINQLKAQSGKHITIEAADILLTDAQHVLDNL